MLVYHGIGRDTTDTADAKYVISRTNFAEQMRALSAAGYHAITTAQLAEYLHSANPSLLPARPVLITFDDGREDAMLQADPILKATGMKATMFVIGADPGKASFYYATWSALSNYASNGRWELANHTDQLHHIEDVNGVPTSDLVRLDPGETIAAVQAADRRRPRRRRVGDRPELARSRDRVCLPVRRLGPELLRRQSQRHSIRCCASGSSWRSTRTASRVGDPRFPATTSCTSTACRR